MKKPFLVLMGLLLLFHGALLAKGPDEKKMRKSAQEMSLGGQMDMAKELAGDLEKSVSETSEGAKGKKSADDGWDMTSLFLGMLWGSIGTGYFMYGKKMGRGAFMLCGIGLCIFPMVVSGNIASLILGLAMTFAPFKLDF